MFIIQIRNNERVIPSEQIQIKNMCVPRIRRLVDIIRRSHFIGTKTFILILDSVINFKNTAVARLTDTRYVGF